MLHQTLKEIERMKASTQVIAKSLQEFDQTLRETELPNDVETTQRLLATQKCEKEAIKVRTVRVRTYLTVRSHLSLPTL